MKRLGTSEQVLPSLRGQNSEFLLKELHKRWTNHRIMVRWLSKFFNYLDRCLLDALIARST